VAVSMGKAKGPPVDDDEGASRTAGGLVGLSTLMLAEGLEVATRAVHDEAAT